MNYTIHGTGIQTLEVHLSRNETLFSDTGAVLSMTPGTLVETHPPGGFSKLLRRAFRGNKMMLNYFHAPHGEESIRFTTRMPGHIIAIPIHNYGRIITERQAFLCAEDSVEYGAEATLNTGRFLGENGLVFAYLDGEGMVFIGVDGEVLTEDLPRGKSMLVHPGHIAAFTATMDYRVQRMQGVQQLSGDDGWYMIRLTGPGRLWLHSIAVHHLAPLLEDYLPRGD